MAVIEITSNNFSENIMEFNGIALVDFYATWCGPCKMMAPVVEQIAEEMPNIKVGKVNVDDNQQLSIQFDIMSIPTIIIYKNGKPQKTLIGLRDKEELVNTIKELI